MTNRDTIEMKLVSQIFDFAKSVADMRLSDEALALYSAYILLQEGMYNHLKYLVQFVIFRNPYLMNMLPMLHQRVSFQLYFLQNQKSD